jgi:hypothetical protein
MFDEQPDGDIHGECAAEIHRLQELVRWAYSKLHGRTFNDIDDALKLDEMKLLLEHEMREAAGRLNTEVTPNTRDELALQAARKVTPYLLGSIQDVTRTTARIQIAVRDALDEVLALAVKGDEK